MTEQAQHLIDGLLETEAALGAVIQWGGRNYPCTGGPVFGGKRLDAGGFRLQADATLVLRLAVFANGTPQEKQLLSYCSTAEDAPRALRIKSATTLWGAVLILECEDPKQGA